MKNARMYGLTLPKDYSQSDMGWGDLDAICSAIELTGGDSQATMVSVGIYFANGEAFY